MPIIEKHLDPIPMTDETTTYVTEGGPTPSSGSWKVSQYIGIRDGLMWKRVWVRTDNYSARKLAGTLPDNPLLYEELKVSAGGYITMTRSDHDWRDEVTLVSTKVVKVVSNAVAVGSLGVPRENREADLITRLLSKARSNQWNAPIFVAELGKTISMVADTARKFVFMARALKRGRLGDFVGLLHPSSKINYNKRKDAWFDLAYGVDPARAAAQAWLQYKYGWMPFVMDVHDATMTLMDLCEEAREGRDASIATVRARIRSDLEEKFLETISGSPNLSCRTTQKTTHTHRAVWKFRVKPQDIPARIGLVNPLEWLWELTPLSFVVDHFTRIGDYLSGFTDKLRFDHVGGQVSYKQTVTTVKDDWQSTDFQSTFGPSASSAYTFVDVNPLGGIPELGVEHLKPEFNPSLARAATWVALITQFTPRSKG